MYFDLEKETEKPLIARALNELGITLINSKPYQTQGEGKVDKEVFNISEVNEISYNSKIYIVPKYKGYSLASMKIEFRENPNKWIKLFYKNELLVKYNLEASNEK